jgi:hypothetical protein
MVDACHIEKFNGLDVWYRNNEDAFKISKKSRYEELKRVIKELTNDDININHSNYIIKQFIKIEKKKDIFNEFNKEDTLIDKFNKIKYVCLCTEGSCTKLFIIQHLISKTYIAVGSICYGRFHESKKEEIKQYNKSICNICYNSLKDIPHYKKTCLDCLKKNNKDKQYCVECCLEIPLNKYRPKCIKCWREDKIKIKFINDEDDDDDDDED